MGMICRGSNLPYLIAVQALLEEHGIPVFVEDLPSNPGYPLTGGRLVAVPNEEHERAMKLLREAGLDPASNDLASGV